jgi:glycine oxidase
VDSDVLIVGAGVIGLSSALALAQSGARVTVLERGLCGAESSWAGGGILSPLCPWDYADAVTRLAGRGAELFPALAQTLLQATGIDPEYEKSGMLVLPPFDARQAAQWCAARGVRVEQGAAVLPQLGQDSLLLPDVAQVRNPKLMRALRRYVESLGVCIVEQCEVRDIVTAGAGIRAVITPRGEFAADHCVIAAGAWSKQVLGAHALQLDIKPMRGQMLLFKFKEPPLRHIVLQHDLYLIPRRDGHLLVGSTLEDVGFDKSTTQPALDALKLRAETLLPELGDMPPVMCWAGLRPGSPHNIPTIARHPQLQNCYLNSGHFRYGVTMAAASAEILKNEMTGAPQALDIAPYQRGWGSGG